MSALNLLQNILGQLQQIIAFLQAHGSAISQAEIAAWSDSASAYTFPLAIILFVMSWKNWRRAEAQYQRWRHAMARMDAILEYDRKNAIAYWVKGELFEIGEYYLEALRCYRMAHHLCPEAYQFSEFRDAVRRLDSHMAGRTKPSPELLVAYSHSL